MYTWRTIYVLLFAIWGTLGVIDGLANAATEPGISIVNRATLSYRDASTGETIELHSNTSRIVVAQLKQFTLLSSQSVELLAGDLVSIAHQLHNTGNVADTYRLQAENVVSDSGDLINLVVYIDTNNNGSVDPGEPVASEDITLAPEESLNFILSGIVPPNQPADSGIDINVLAISLDNNNPDQRITDHISIIASPDLEIQLSNSPDCGKELYPEDKIEYEILVQNNNATLPTPKEYLIDGARSEGILTYVEIPGSLNINKQETLESASFRTSVLVQPVGESVNWMRLEHWDEETTIARIGFLLPAHAFEEKESTTIALITSVAGSSESEFSIVATLDIKKDGYSVTKTAPVCNTVAKPAAAVSSEIRFIAPVLSLQRTATAPNFSADEDFTDAPVYRLKNSDDDYSLVRDGVYIELNADVPVLQLIKDPEENNYVLVELVSAIISSNSRSIAQRDLIHVLLRETTAGSGRFRSIRPVWLSTNLSADGANCPGDSTAVLPGLANYQESLDVCVLNSAPDDTLTVSFNNNLNRDQLLDNAVVDPVSRVFDSITLNGISNVEISVYQDDKIAINPLSGEPIVLTSDMAGRFTLPRLENSQSYHIIVQPPAGYRYPSRIEPEQFSTYTVTQASYGKSGYIQSGRGRFDIENNEPSPITDIPLDPTNAETLLQVSKSANSTLLEIGDALTYTVELTNNSDATFENTLILDTPPVGFRYLPGSSAIDGITLDDPTRLATSNSNSASDGDQLNLYFELGTIEPTATYSLTYRLQATAGAKQSDGVNTAIASAATPSGITISTNPSRTKVQLNDTGILSDKAILFGKIYVDSSCDNIHNKSEWPIAGVKLYLQDGTFVTTDEDGQYSLYGLQPGMHVIKIDTLTLPMGLKLKPLDTKHAADPESRFVDLSDGDFHRADFATYCPQENSEQVFNLLKERNLNLRGAWLLDEAIRFNPESSSRKSTTRNQAGFDGDLSSGHISRGENRKEKDWAKIEGKNTTQRNQLLPSDKAGSTTQVQKMGDPKSLAKSITQAQAKRGTWLWPVTDLANDGRFMAVIRAGLDPTLYLNNKPVSVNQIGERIVNRREKAQIVAWYGINLKPGENKVEIKGKDTFGNTRVLAAGKFKKSSAAVRMYLNSKQDSLPADGGRTLLPINVVLADQNGYPTNGVYFVTLHSTSGDFLESDLQPREPGLQIRVENGRAVIHLRSTDSTGKLRINAQTGSIKAHIDLVQVPAPRPLIGAGLLDIGAKWTDIDADRDTRQNLEDGFDPHARGAMFLKGKIRNDFQLTLSLDTEKKHSKSIARNINPNDHYPTFGDSSIRGFEAQSRSKLYAKLERGRHSAMWGDYVTDHLSPDHDLGRINRTLTGFNSVFDNKNTRIQLFAAEQQDAHIVEEIRGNGTAMLFNLSDVPIVQNSEVIKLITRDRDLASRILETTRLVKYTDYTIDYQTGRLSFSYTIPSVDENLNPVFVSVNYDKASRLDEYLVAGLRVQQQIGMNASLGFSLTRDENPLSGYTMAGINFKSQLGSNTFLTAATAQQENNTNENNGSAQQVKIEHNWFNQPDNKTSLDWSNTDMNFNNPGVGANPGQQEWRIEHRQRLGNTLKAVAEALHTESDSDNTSTTTASLIFDKSYTNWSLRAGSRHVQSKSTLQDLSFSTFLIGVKKQFQFGASRNGSIGIDYERAIDDKERFRLGVNTKFSVHENANLYGRYEREQRLAITSLTNNSINSESNTQLALGIESDIFANTELYSEYRMRGNFSGESIETASGARGNYTIAPGLSVSPAFEYIDVLDRSQGQDSIAFSLGLTDTRNPNRKLNAQVEIRDTSDNIYYGFRATLAQRLSLDWTGLVREEFTRQTPDVDELTSRHRFTLGLARRPKLNNKHHTLFLANWNEDYGPQNGMDRTSYLFSTHHNRQINERFSIAGRAGGKWQTIKFDQGSQSTSVFLTDLKVNVQWKRRWDAELRVGWLGTDSGNYVRGDNSYSFGAGLSWLVDRNLRFSFGYNFLGFREEDLDQQALNAQGVNLGLQMKFDEDWFRWLEK